MIIETSKNTSKNMVFDEVMFKLRQNGFGITNFDASRPWGGFFVIDETQAKEFAGLFFPEFEFSQIQITQKLSPKILIVEPQKRLSWQYHFKRAEIWKIISTEPVGIKRSIDDIEPMNVETLCQNDIITMQKGERHRLIGLETYGVVAEIWQHTDPNNPSDEEDIVRLQDDFGR